MADERAFVPSGASVPSILSVRGLHAHYGESHVLHGVDLDVAPGELVALVGRNGAGRSTTLKSILGLVPRRSGSVRVFGQETIGMSPFRIARLGIGYCPEDRGIFASLSVEENLMLPPRVGAGSWGIPDSADGRREMSLDEIFTLFPNLKERRRSVGTKLSGGEQQMLAMARILRTGAKLLLLDEITEGLAPVIVQTLGEAVRALKARGFTIVLVEQNFRFTSALADRYYVLEHGTVAEMIRGDELRRDSDGTRARLNRYLSV